MALTVTSRGTGTHNTGATTLVPGGRTATLAVGSMGVLCIAADNASSGGATLMAPATWTDAKGNTWTLRTNRLFDNGAASAGIEMMFYTAPITVALLTTDLGTITWGGGVSPVAKAWTWYEVIPSGANTVSYEAGGDIAGATAANASVTTGTVKVGDAVIAGYFSENVNAVTGDSDTTNGTWTAQQTATVGAGTSGVRVASQQKVQTTTDSTQTYDVTVASQDRIAGYIVLHEVVNTTLTPAIATLTLTAFAPKLDEKLTPTNAALVLTGFAPKLDEKLTPGVAAALTLTTFAPSVTVGITVTPGTATLALALASFAPAVVLGTVVTPATATLVITGFAPVLTETLTPATATLALASFAPSVTFTANVTLTPAPASLVLTGFAPTITGPVDETPPVGAGRGHRVGFLRESDPRRNVSGPSVIVAPFARLQSDGLVSTPVSGLLVVEAAVPQFSGQGLVSPPVAGTSELHGIAPALAKAHGRNLSLDVQAWRELQARDEEALTLTGAL